MNHTLPPLRLTGASVLRDKTLAQGALSLIEGRITDDPLPEIDLTGYYILPGIVDLHGDAFERHLAPRPTARFPIRMGLASTDRDLASNGVTTAWLAQSWSWEGGLRGPDYTEELLAEWQAYRPEALTDMRVQIRCETHMPDTRDRLIAAVERFGVDYVIFNDHLPEALQMVTTTPHRLAHWAEREGGTIEDFAARVRAARDTAPNVPRHLCALARAFDRLGVVYGSHDDPDGETRDRYHHIGAHVCEFPTRVNAASVARTYGDPVIMGAPNVVRGGSQSGNVSAVRLISNRLCTALVSDYHYPTLSAAAWKLAETGVKPFAEAWEMISTAPARIMRLDDRGTLAPGKRADLVVMNPETRQIEATIAAGRLVWLSGEAGTRFFAGLTRSRFAAE